MRDPPRRARGCESRVFGEDYICADQTGEGHRVQQGKTDPLGIGEIDVGTVVVQCVYETESVIWGRWMGIKVAEIQKQIRSKGGCAKCEN